MVIGFEPFLFIGLVFSKMQYVSQLGLIKIPVIAGQGDALL